MTSTNNQDTSTSSNSSILTTSEAVLGFMFLLKDTNPSNTDLPALHLELVAVHSALSDSTCLRLSALFKLFMPKVEHFKYLVHLKVTTLRKPCFFFSSADTVDQHRDVDEFRTKKRRLEDLFLFQFVSGSRFLSEGWVLLLSGCLCSQKKNEARVPGRTTIQLCVQIHSSHHRAEPASKQAAPL